MSRKLWFILASVFIIVGITLFVITMSILKWDFFKLSNEDYQTKTYEITEDFNDLSIVIDTADVTFAVSQNQTTSVVCYEDTKFYHTVEVQDDTLKVKINDNRKWYDYISIINLNSPSITVYLPKTEYNALSIDGSTSDVSIPQEFKFNSMQISLSTGDTTTNASVTSQLKIKTSSGNINIANATVGSLDLTVSTGTVSVYGVTALGDVTVNVSTGDSYLTNLSCSSLISSGNTGDVTLNNVIASEKFYIERSTGDVEFEACDASEIYILTDTGDVDGSLLSEKIFVVNTNTGEIEVPLCLSGGKCQITTNTGDIEIHIKGQN